MSFLAGQTNPPANEPKALGLDNSRLSTNEQGVILRYFAGVARFGLTWLAEAYNQKTKGVKNSSSGKGSSGSSSSHKYYADCAGLACVGLVDAIAEIWMSNEQVWSGPLERTPGSDSAEITVEGKGTLTIYWGTETQPIDPILAPHDHPAYRGQCYLVFHQLYFGQDTTTAPNVEVVLIRAPQNSPLDAPAALDDDCVPAHAIMELLANERFGLGWVAADTLDLASWEATARQLADEGIAISPMIDREQDARTLLLQFCEYFDGYLVADPARGGRLALRLARPFDGDPEALPLLGEFDLLDVPNPVSQHWRETYNEFTVKYTDRESDFQNNSTTVIDPANRRVVGEPLPLQLDRAWVTSEALAVQMGHYAARLQSVPWVTAKEIHVRKESAAGIAPGSFVRLTYQDYQETIIMRVMSRKVEADRSQSVEFELRADGYYNEILPYTPDLPPPPDKPVIYPEPPIYQRILEVPFGLLPANVNPRRPQLAALVARGGALDVRYRVYSSEDNATYDEDVHSRRFAVYGTLAAPLGLTHTLDDGDAGILIHLPGVDDELDIESMNEPSRLKMRLLVFAEDEIISYREAVITATHQVRLIGLRRGCYDTFMAAHATGTPLTIIRRRDLHLWTSSTYDRGDTVFLKVATATARAMQDLGDVDEVPFGITGRSSCPLPPLNLRVNGAGVSPTYVAGNDVLIEFDPASWLRHDFWASWDEVYADPRLSHKVRIFGLNGLRKQNRNLTPGVTNFTYVAADLLADFGGSYPAAFEVRAFSRRRGARSPVALSQIVKLSAAPGVNPLPRTTWMYPSNMSQILGACDPVTLVDRNLTLCAARFGVALSPTTDEDEDSAPAVLQANFTALAAALNVTLYPVVPSRDPEVATQANFEIINGKW